jgi:hypothetical protein
VRRIALAAALCLAAAARAADIPNHPTDLTTRTIDIPSDAPETPIAVASPIG